MVTIDLTSRVPNHKELNFDNFIHTFLSALMVVFGVIWMNLADENKNDKLKIFNNNLLQNLGIALLIVGWVNVMYALNDSRQGVNFIFISACSMLLIAVMIGIRSNKEYYEEKNLEPPSWTKALLPLYAGLFLILILSVIVDSGVDEVHESNLTGIKKYLSYFAQEINFRTGMAIIAYALMMASKIVIVPWENENNVVNSPGYVLQVISWLIVAYLNSTRSFVN